MSSDLDKRNMGPFELEQRLGVGGMGIVYLARYTKTGQRVAVKVLSPDLMADEKIARRFQREMDILKKLKHPHIVQYYGGSTSGSQRFYAMELVKGGSLQSMIKRKGPLSWEEAVEYGLQVTQALEHAHSAGVIHRDLKPANLLLTTKGVMKLSDFGIARDTQSTALTAAGKTVGTMSYMAPEQITGKHPISAKTDLYALGCVLFEMLTGRTPFVTDTAPEMLFKHLDEEPPSVREYNITVPIWLDHLIAELLAKDPADRPFDALAVQVKLEEVKERMAAGKSIAQQTAAGGGMVTIKEGDRELAQLLGRPKKKRKRKKQEHVPIYERMWFLTLALVGVVALLTRGFWPASEQDRFAELAQLRESGEANSIVDKYKLQGFLDDFPDGQHVEQVQQWIDDIEMTQAEKKAEQREKQGRDPESHAERLYMEARKFERLGDRLTALKKFQAMQSLFENDEEARPYVNLARRQARQVQESIGGEDDPVAFVDRQIEEADRLFFQGQRAQAQSRWSDLVALYENLPEHQDQVQRVRHRIVDPEWALAVEYELGTAIDEASRQQDPSQGPDNP